MWKIDSDDVAHNEFGESIWIEQRGSWFYVRGAEWRQFRNGRALLNSTVASPFLTYDKAREWLFGHVDYLNLKYLPIRELYAELDRRRKTRMNSLFT